MPKDRKPKKYRKSRYHPYKGAYRRMGITRNENVVGHVMPGVSARSNLFGFPDNLVVNMRYVDNYTLVSTAGSIAKQVFRWNSVVDPDFTGAGHQPFYFDQIAAVYENYVVLGAKAKVTFSPIMDAIVTAQPAGPFNVGLVSEPNGTTSSTLSTLLEQSKTYSTILGSGQGGNNVVTLYSNYSPTRDLGVTPDDDTAGASTTSSPSATWFLTAFVQDSGLSSAGACLVKAEIDFVVRFRRRLDIAGS